MLRREFCKSLTTLFFLPFFKFPEEVDEIVSASINTSFNLEPIFTQGDLRIYPTNDKPLIDITLEYSSGKIENYTADNKTWVKKCNNSLLYSILYVLHGFAKYKASIKLDKKLMKLIVEVENCSCIITGLKPV